VEVLKNIDARSATCFLITNGVGLIGSVVIKYLIQEMGHEVINPDKASYASNIEPEVFT